MIMWYVIDAQSFDILAEFDERNEQEAREYARRESLRRSPRHPGVCVRKVEADSSGVAA